jgi:PhzF family phenazine biosynthesis protein
MTTDHTLPRLVRVFVGADGRGGNPAPIVLDASAMSDDAMRQVAAQAGHESGFVVPVEDGSAADFRFRFFVPLHEMEMCGHATVGALWCLRRAGLWCASQATVQTRSGLVRGFVRDPGSAHERIEITQPVGRVQALEAAETALVADALRVPAAHLLDLPMLNASTSRVKTLVGIRSPALLDALRPDFTRMQAVCEAIGSTGLYPFAVDEVAAGVFHARQFPRASGYPEDAATGIAAAALLFGLRELGLVAVDAAGITVCQGRAMGSPSEIRVRFELDARGEPVGCFLGGTVR